MIGLFCSGYYLWYIWLWCEIIYCGNYYFGLLLMLSWLCVIYIGIWLLDFFVYKVLDLRLYIVYNFCDIYSFNI